MHKKYAPEISKLDFDNKDILEIGSGYGGFSLEHFLNAKSVYGIDTSPEAVAYLEKNWPVPKIEQHFVFQEGNIVEMSLRAKEFDMVVFSNSF